MENAILENNGEYISLLNDIEPDIFRITITLLNKDKSPSKQFLEKLEKILNNAPREKAIKKRGPAGSVVYMFYKSTDIISFLYTLDNFFVLEKELLDEDYRTRIKNYKLIVVPTEIGFSDIIVHDKDSDLILQTITHEGILFLNVAKYPSLKRYVFEESRKDRYYL